jgi:Asp-tRNA(Asn)/Glu-tRNA(Gln) amidotransferase C subunit
VNTGIENEDQSNQSKLFITDDQLRSLVRMADLELSVVRLEQLNRNVASLRESFKKVRDFDIGEHEPSVLTFTRESRP